MNNKIKSKKYIAVILSSFFLLGILLPSSYAVSLNKTIGTYTYDDNIFYVGGNGPNNYTNIQDAIDDASPGDTVFVYDDSSPYNGKISITKSINLIGEDRNTTIIFGVDKEDIVNIISCDNVLVENFNITNGEDAISLEGSNNCVISKNNLIGHLDRGIWLWESHNNLIIDNYLCGPDEHFWDGIRLFYSENNNVTNNIIKDVWERSMVLSHCENNFICNNVIYNNHSHFCINLEDSSRNSVINNTINVYGTVPHADFEYINVWGNYNSIIGNKLLAYHPGPDVGINVRGRNNLISRNLINSIHGLAIELDQRYSSFNIISYNDIIDNNRGIWIIGGDFNQIICNNFQNNGHDAFFYLFSLFNRWDGNYWNGSRLSPYPVIGRLFLSIIPLVKFDWNPASEPYEIKL